MPHTITKTVYKFEELSDSAKEKARDWFREGNCHDEWWDCCYEDFATIAEIIGIDLKQRPVKLCGGGTRMEPSIYFSGFCSQGDGASFDGFYRYAVGSVKKIKSHAPQDKELHKIAEELYEMQRRTFYKISAQVKQTGRYHSLSVDVGCDHEIAADRFNEIERGVTECMNDFAHWMYRQLEKEWDYQNSDEVVDENIKCNEYDFDEDGRRTT